MGYRTRSGMVAVLLAVGACGSPGREPGVPRPVGEEVEPALPPIPARTGPLALDLVYPAEGGAVAVRDSTFVFGSTGTGSATLRINGTPVPVERNGAFLAFLPVPADGRYRVVATANGETATLEREVRVPPPPPSLLRDTVAILAGSVSPRGGWTVLPRERIPVGFRGTPGGEAALVLPDGRRVPLVEDAARAEEAWGQRAFGTDPESVRAVRVGGISSYQGYFEAVPLATPDTTVPLPTLAAHSPADGEVPVIAAAAGEVIEEARRAEAGDTLDSRLPGAYVELVVGDDTARAPLPLNLALLDADRPPVGVVRDPGAFGTESDSIVVASPQPGGTYHYFWPDGTVVTLTGERAGDYRVRLTPELSAWVDAEAVRILRAGTPPPGGAIGTVRFTSREEWIDVRVATPGRLPFRVDQEEEQALALTVYGGTGNTGWLQYGSTDPLIERAEWSTPGTETYRLTVRLTDPVWGYRTRWAENGDLILQIRRPPAIDPDRPLDGLRIVLDPGHPPAGAIGPTRLTEAEANLSIALELLPLLERAGAEVILTRTDMTAVPLVWRPLLAMREDADILVSIHNNAFPDGVNPFVNNGTSVYYFHPHAVDLAQALQRSLVEELELRDLGIGRSSLALVRPTWMPSVLTETMYLMIPRQEAALRDPEVQERIARAHLRALEAFVRGRAARRD